VAPVGRVATTRGGGSGWNSLTASMKRRLRSDRNSPAANQIVLTGTDATSGTRSRAASHRPSDDVASMSNPSTPAWVATCCTIHPGNNALRLEKVTAIEDEGIWRDMAALSELCVGDHARRRGGRPRPESSTACLLAQTSMSLPVKSHSGRRELDWTAKRRRRFPDCQTRIVFCPKMG
jgi:hypothetical protein